MLGKKILRFLLFTALVIVVAFFVLRYLANRPFPTSQVVIQDAVLYRGSNYESERSVSHIALRITNNANFDLYSVAIRIDVLDKAGNVIDGAMAHVYEYVPALSTRTANSTFGTISRLPDGWSWAYRVVEAKRPAPWE